MYFVCISYHKASSISLSSLQHQKYHYLRNYWMNFWDQNWLFLRIMRTVFPHILWLLWELLFKRENLLLGIVSPNNAILQSLKKSVWQKKNSLSKTMCLIFCKLIQFLWRLDIFIACNFFKCHCSKNIFNCRIYLQLSKVV